MQNYLFKVRRMIGVQDSLPTPPILPRSLTNGYFSKMEMQGAVRLSKDAYYMAIVRSLIDTLTSEIASHARDDSIALTEAATTALTDHTIAQIVAELARQTADTAIQARTIATTTATLDRPTPVPPTAPESLTRRSGHRPGQSYNTPAPDAGPSHQPPTSLHIRLTHGKPHGAWSTAATLHTVLTVMWRDKSRRRCQGGWESRSTLHHCDARDVWAQGAG